MPNENNIYKALIEIYNWSDEHRQGMIKKGIEFTGNFTVDIIGDKLVDICYKMYERWNNHLKGKSVFLKSNAS